MTTTSEDTNSVLPTTMDQTKSEDSPQSGDVEVKRETDPNADNKESSEKESGVVKRKENSELHPEEYKIFVGGLPQDCTQADLRDYFSTLGDVVNVILKIDPNTGRSRGFGFVTFADADVMESVLAKGEHGHTVRDKKIAVKRAAGKQGKVYVGKFPSSLTNDALKSVFSRYGTVVEFQRPIDKSSKEPKDFCFVTFEREHPAELLLRQGSINIDGHNVNIKKVASRDQNVMNMLLPHPNMLMMPGSPGFFYTGHPAARPGLGVPHNTAAFCNPAAAAAAAASCISGFFAGSPWPLAHPAYPPHFGANFNVRPQSHHHQQQHAHHGHHLHGSTGHHSGNQHSNASSASHITHHGHAHGSSSHASSVTSPASMSTNSSHNSHANIDWIRAYAEWNPYLVRSPMPSNQMGHHHPPPSFADNAASPNSFSSPPSASGGGPLGSNSHSSSTSVGGRPTSAGHQPSQSGQQMGSASRYNSQYGQRSSK